MEETAPIVNVVFPRKVRPAIDIAALTVIAMIIVFLLSEFSFGTASAVGSFAGFCMAAWNWLRMGRRRKALAHFAAAFGVYAFIGFGSAFVAIALIRLFVRSVPTTVEQSAIPGLLPASTSVVNVIQNGLVPAIGTLLFVIITGALAVGYLYKATAHDVRQYQPANDKVELRYLLPFVGVAVISAASIHGSSVILAQVPIAQFQNHVYCEVLQPGQSLYEVSQTLNKIGRNERLDVKKGYVPSLAGVAYYQDVWWDDYGIELKYDLSLRLGFDSNSKLVWVGRYQDILGNKSGKGDLVATTCPWTVFNSLTAR